MTEKLIEDERKPILVLCHSFFNDAFRDYPKFEIKTFQNSMSAREVARFIIYRQAELPEGQFISTTSKKVFDDFIKKIELESIGGTRYEMVELLKNTIFIVPDDVINNLDMDETVIALADILYTRSKYKPVILVTNIESKKEMVEKFYSESLGEREFKRIGIPFDIYTTEETFIFLKAKFQ